MPVDNKMNIKEWSSVPSNVIADFGDEGDFSRQHILNPTYHVPSFILIHAIKT